MSCTLTCIGPKRVRASVVTLANQNSLVSSTPHSLLLLTSSVRASTISGERRTATFLPPLAAEFLFKPGPWQVLCLSLKPLSSNLKTSPAHLRSIKKQSFWQVLLWPFLHIFEMPSLLIFEMPYEHFTFTFSHLADAFIQSDLQLRTKSNNSL